MSADDFDLAVENIDQLLSSRDLAAELDHLAGDAALAGLTAGFHEIGAEGGFFSFERSQLVIGAVALLAEQCAALGEEGDFLFGFSLVAEQGEDAVFERHGSSSLDGR